VQVQGHFLALSNLNKLRFTIGVVTCYFVFFALSGCSEAPSAGSKSVRNAGADDGPKHYVIPSDPPTEVAVEDEGVATVPADDFARANGQENSARVLAKIHKAADKKSEVLYKISKGTVVFVTSIGEDVVPAEGTIKDDWVAVLFSASERGYLLRKQLAKKFEIPGVVVPYRSDNTVSPNPRSAGSSYERPSRPRSYEIDATSVVSAGEEFVYESERMKRTVDEFSDGYSNWKDVVSDLHTRMRSVTDALEDLEAACSGMASRQNQFTDAQAESFTALISAIGEADDSLFMLKREVADFSSGEDWSSVVGWVQTRTRTFMWDVDDVESTLSEVEAAF
jgi:hypothetical protein